jgi:hypothetical protein
MALFSSTGGVVYHLRAQRYRRTLWLPFRQAVESWLVQALPPSAELILVGPSAGSCLPLTHLSRFGEVIVLEPDGLARLVLRSRLAGARVTSRASDLLVAPLLSDAPGLDRLLEARPHASLLFCNVLGQLQLTLSEEEHAAWRAAFQRRILPALEGRRWASFHDRWSLERDGEAPPVPQSTRFERVPEEQELARTLFGPEGPALTVLDHGTAGLFPETGPHHYFAWQLTPTALHVVEAVSG